MNFFNKNSAVVPKQQQQRETQQKQELNNENLNFYFPTNQINPSHISIQHTISTFPLVSNNLKKSEETSFHNSSQLNSNQTCRFDPALTYHCSVTFNGNVLLNTSSSFPSQSNNNHINSNQTYFLKPNSNLANQNQNFNLYSSFPNNSNYNSIYNEINNNAMKKLNSSNTFFDMKSSTSEDIFNKKKFCLNRTIYLPKSQCSNMNNEYNEPSTDSLSIGNDECEYENTSFLNSESNSISDVDTLAELDSNKSVKSSNGSLRVERSYVPYVPSSDEAGQKSRDFKTEINFKAKPFRVFNEQEDALALDDDQKNYIIKKIAELARQRASMPQKKTTAVINTF